MVSGDTGNDWSFCIGEYLMKVVENFRIIFFKLLQRIHVVEMVMKSIGEVMCKHWNFI